MLLAVAVLVAVLAVVIAGYLVTRPNPVLSLSSPTVQAGDTLTVSATSLPANQSGEMQLHSTIHTVPFRSDSAGRATVYLRIPIETAPGPHTISICWNASCHGSTSLQVLAPPALATPSPTPGPSPTPIASPTPSVRTLALSSGRIRVATGTMAVKGLSFTPFREVTLTFIQGTLTNVIVQRVTTVADGTFLTSYRIPPKAVVGSAYLRACDPNGCAFAAITVSATG